MGKPDCEHRGSVVTGRSSSKTWYHCNHPRRVALRIAETNCSCGGCGSGCRGYEAIWEFKLILEGMSLTAELCESLLRQFRSDAKISQQGGSVHLDISLRARTIKDAAAIAVSQVRAAGVFGAGITFTHE